MSTMSVRLPESLHKQARELAEREGVSINQLVDTALAEKVSALLTVKYLEERASRGSAELYSPITTPGRAPTLPASLLQQEQFMYRAIVLVSLVTAAACAPQAGHRPAPHAPAMVGSLSLRVPERVGEYTLTERSFVRGSPNDSIFRFSDGTATRLSVIVYDVGEDVRVEADSQKWTAREGEKFAATQEILRSRGDIAAYVVAFSDTARITAGDRDLLEHSVAVPVRARNGTVSVEFQYLYLIRGRFVKVRATVPEQGWQRTNVPAFARELAQVLAREN